MRLYDSLRVAALVGIAAVSAVVAHASFAALGAWPWMAAALAGSALTAIGLLGAGAAADRRRRRLHGAAVLGRADLRAVSLARLPFGAVAGALLVCQGGAHLGLILLGVHAGTPAAPALHVLLALAGTLLFRAVDRSLRRMLASSDRVAARLLAALDAPADVPWTRWRSLPAAPRPRASTVLGRAPPLLTLS